MRLAEEPARRGTRPSTLTLVTLAVVSAVFCAPGAADGLQTDPGATVSDSSGIRIVEWAYPDTTVGPSWVLAEEPRLEVGGPGADGPYALERVGPMLRTEDGIVLAAAGTTELRFFDNDGRYVRTVVGDEDMGVRFTAIRGLDRLPGGRIFVFDLTHAVVILDSEGRVVEQHSAGGMWFTSSLSNGTAVGRAGPMAEPVAVDAGLIRTTTTIRLLDLQTGEISELVSLPGLTWYRGLDGRRRSPSWATRSGASTGSDRIAARWSGEPSVKVFDDEGRLTTIVRWDQATEPVSPGEIESFVQSVEEERRAAVREVLNSQVIPRQIVRGVTLDEEGNLWVRPEGRDGAPALRRLMFAFDGARSGYMEIHPRARVAKISRHEVAGLWFVDGRPVARVYEVREVRDR